MVTSVRDVLVGYGLGASQKKLAIIAHKLKMERRELENINLDELTPKKRAEILSKTDIPNLSTKKSWR